MLYGKIVFHVSLLDIFSFPQIYRMSSNLVNVQVFTDFDGTLSIEGKTSIESQATWTLN